MRRNHTDKEDEMTEKETSLELGKRLQREAREKARNKPQGKVKTKPPKNRYRGIVDKRKGR